MRHTIDCPSASTVAAHREPELALESVIDRFEVWLPEDIAVANLRGFANGVGGELEECPRGAVRMRLAGPTQPSGNAGGFWSWFRSAPTEPVFETIELHLRKQPTAGRSLVDISVIRLALPDESARQKDAGR